MVYTTYNKNHTSYYYNILLLIFAYLHKLQQKVQQVRFFISDNRDSFEFMSRDAIRGKMRLIAHDGVGIIIITTQH